MPLKIHINIPLARIFCFYQKLKLTGWICLYFIWYIYIYTHMYARTYIHIHTCIYTSVWYSIGTYLQPELLPYSAPYMSSFEFKIIWYYRSSNNWTHERNWTEPLKKFGFLMNRVWNKPPSTDANPSKFQTLSFANLHGLQSWDASLSEQQIKQ